MTTATAPSFLANALGLIRRPVWARCTEHSGHVAPTCLLPGQALTLHAAQGMNLCVLSGRIWLTQPGASQDVFLTAGEALELTQDWVVIEADALPDAPPHAAHAAYRLVPLARSLATAP